MYLTHKNLDDYWVVDIETDDLDATTIWCIVLQCVGSKEIVKLYGEKIFEKFSEWLERNKTCVLVGHNILSFDVPVLNRLCGTSIPFDRCVDTLVLSMLYHPQMPQGHSLAAWGERFKLDKLEFDDWSGFSEEMLTYCVRDVELTVKLFLALTKRMRDAGFSEQSAQIEHQIRTVLDEQQRNGFWFDRDGAVELRDTLRAREQDAESRVQTVFPPELKSRGTYKYRVRSDKTPYATYLKHVERFPNIEFSEDNSEYTVYDYETFNLGSPLQRRDRLLGMGWKPKTFTPKGNPKVDEESLVAFADKSGTEEVGLIADWLVYNGRANMIDNWLKHLGEDGRIHGRVLTCGAATRRMRHQNPNTANIPGNDARFGHECRSLFGVDPRGDRVLVGYDASALEGRILCHYLANPDATSYFLEGDPHQANADAVGVSRVVAKTLFYAFLYGAGNGKLGDIVGGSSRDGLKAREALTHAVPGLKRLMGSLNAEFNNGGVLQTIDGGFVRCPSSHAALNYKCQSAGGILMKQTSIILDRSIKAFGWDALKVGDIHDEGQLDTLRAHGDHVGKAAVHALEEAGRVLGCRVPITGEYKIGSNWSETH